MAKYYTAQQSFDERRRDARDFLAESFGIDSANNLVAIAGGDVTKAIEKLRKVVYSESCALPSGPPRHGILRRLSQCERHITALTAAASASIDAEQVLRHRCRTQMRVYIHWVGTDSGFWLSFVRACGNNDRAGGLLDALAKVYALTVRVWADKDSKDNCDERPRLELVHEVKFGSRHVDLWYQGRRSHFDRLVAHGPSH